MHEKLLIIDFGSQYTQLIARRIREQNVYSEIIHWNKDFQLDDDIKGVILSGGPSSVRDENAPDIDLSKLVNHVPVLGICYGAQLLTRNFGGTVQQSKTREFGRAILTHTSSNTGILNGETAGSAVWMSHGDSITQLAPQFECIASTEEVQNAAFASKTDEFQHPVFGLQFHPEVYHTAQGEQILKTFLFESCSFSADWTPAIFIEETVDALRAEIGEKVVILGLSGGVDSSVASILLKKAIGEQLHCIFIDNGLLRKAEFESVLKSYEQLGLNIRGIRAADEFLSELEGVSDPEKKRKIIGRVFVEVFQREAAKIEGADFLAQGTIYPDVVESAATDGPAVKIKSHHNVGGLPDSLHLKVVEPLGLLFKDEVRRVGAALELPKEILSRHPFPGPGLAVRILGPISRERVQILQEADHIYIENLKKFKLYDKVWQAGAILLSVNSVGVMGDERTYESVLALRAVNSTDGMTADWSRLPDDFLAETSNDIINKVKGINRVVYDISSKPPATIEWE